MSIFISDALAATNTAASSAAAATQSTAGSSSASLIMLVVFVAVFYFLLIRPQSKRAKEHRNLLANLATNDEVVTNGGVLGKIVELQDDFVTLNIANNVDIKVQKSAIVNVLPKGTLKA